MEKIKINTQNSGRVKLLRYVVRFATKESPQEKGLLHFADQMQKVNDVLLKPNKTGLPTADIFEELHSRLKFLGLPKEQLIGAISMLANSAADTVPFEKVMIDGEGANVTAKKAQLRGANSLAADKKGINPVIAQMVADASLGKNSIPFVYSNVTVKGVEALLTVPKANEKVSHIPAPVVATMGRCECCVAGNYRHLLDSLIKTADLEPGSISKICKKVPSAGISDLQAREILDDISGEGTLTPSAIMAYMMKFDSSSYQDSLIIPVLTFKATRTLKGRGKDKVVMQSGWTISWHCVECLRDYFFPRTDGDVRARIHAHNRMVDVRNLLTKDISSGISKMWSEKYKAARDAKTKAVINLQAENISKGKTRSGGAMNDPATVAEVLDRFVSLFGDKSPEVRKHLFYDKSRTKSSLTKWGVKRDSSFGQVHKILIKAERDVKANQDELVAVMDVIADLTTPGGIEGGEE